MASELAALDIPSKAHHCHTITATVVLDMRAHSVLIEAVSYDRGRPGVHPSVAEFLVRDRGTGCSWHTDDTGTRSARRPRRHTRAPNRARKPRWGRLRHRANAPPPRSRPDRRPAAHHATRPAGPSRASPAHSPAPGCGSRARSSTPPDRRWPRSSLPARPAAAGVDVVVDRPPLELRDRQHGFTHLPTGALRTCCTATILAPLCKCAVAIYRWFGTVMGQIVWARRDFRRVGRS